MVTVVLVPTLAVALIFVLASAPLGLASSLPASSVAMLKKLYLCPGVPTNVADVPVVPPRNNWYAPPLSDT